VALMVHEEEEMAERNNKSGSHFPIGSQKKKIDQFFLAISN